jgi:hypothetical protein
LLQDQGPSSPNDPALHQPEWHPSARLAIDGKKFKMTSQNHQIRLLMGKVIDTVQASVILEDLFPDNSKRDALVKETLKLTAKTLGSEYAAIRERLKKDTTFVRNLLIPV